MKVIGEDSDGALTIQFDKIERDALFYILQTNDDESLLDYFSHSLFKNELLKIKGMLSIKRQLYSSFRSH